MPHFRIFNSRHLRMLHCRNGHAYKGAADAFVIHEDDPPSKAIATVEFLQGQWPDLIEVLLRFVNSGTSVPLRRSTLSTIGSICEALDPDVLHMHADEILTAMAHGARKEEPSTDARIATIGAVQVARIRPQELEARWKQPTPARVVFPVAAQAQVQASYHPAVCPGVHLAIRVVVHHTLAHIHSALILLPKPNCNRPYKQANGLIPCYRSKLGVGVALICGVQSTKGHEPAAREEQHCGAAMVGIQEGRTPTRNV
ncbi:hypothetical protein BC834DRAFT_970971 [Gloeopeniophorella convolvens]|nr:hypothetical protein BC834DRAFT_970971 [Gloeopeniophorella convolvens]